MRISIERSILVVVADADAAEQFIQELIKKY